MKNVMKTALTVLGLAVLVLAGSLLLLSIPLAIVWMVLVRSPYNQDLAMSILVAVGGVTFIVGVIISAIRAERKSFCHCQNTRCVNHKYVELCKNFFM